MLLNEGGSTFVGKEDPLNLLSTLGKNVAVNAEAGEDLTAISTGTLDLKVWLTRWFYLLGGKDDPYKKFIYKHASGGAGG